VLLLRISNKMTLEKFFKKGKAFAVGLALASALAGGCNNSSGGGDSGSGNGGSSSGGTPPVVTYPETTISAPDFGNGLDGIVNYIVTGQNAKCPISRINLKVNGTAYDVPADPNVEILSVDVPDVPIIDGANDLIATAYSNCDGKEVADQTPAEYAFTPATEDEARAKIDEFLQARNYNYISDTGIIDGSIPPKTLVSRVDRSVDTIRNSQGFFVINYTSYGDDFAQAQIDKKTEDNNNIENYNYTYLPSDELSARLNQIPQ